MRCRLNNQLSFMLEEKKYKVDTCHSQNRFISLGSSSLTGLERWQICIDDCLVGLQQVQNERNAMLFLFFPKESCVSTSPPPPPECKDHKNSPLHFPISGLLCHLFFLLRTQAAPKANKFPHWSLKKHFFSGPIGRPILFFLPKFYCPLFKLAKLRIHSPSREAEEEEKQLFFCLGNEPIKPRREFSVLLQYSWTPISGNFTNICLLLSPYVPYVPN